VDARAFGIPIELNAELCSVQYHARGLSDTSDKLC
jgi:hypothetical protein